VCGSDEYTLTPSKHNKKEKKTILFVDDDHDTASSGNSSRTK
jgi:hypothetical protein